MSPRLILLMRRAAHYAVYVAGGMVSIMCLIALALKFWAMPNVERYRADLEAAASRAAGVPVQIGALHADWRGINPRLTLTDVRLAPAQGEALQFPHVEAVASWWSLALFDLRLARLDIEQAHFPLRRTTDGVIYLAGIALNVPAAPNPFPDWLLRQPRIVVRDAQVSWHDELLAAPVLHLNGVRLLLENQFGRHRFGGVALPSAGATRLQLRGDLRGDSVHAPQSWNGTLYAQVDAARFETWAQWAPWAQQAVKRGTGNLRFWLTLADGQAQGLTGDADLNDVAVNLEAGLPDLHFQTLNGRIGWAREALAHTFSVENLRFKTADSPLSEPASLRLTLTPAASGGYERIQGQAGNLRLEALTALSGALPLPRQAHDLIATIAPRGLLESAEGEWSKTRDFRVRVALREGGMQPYQAIPGFSGLNLALEADQAGGKAQLASQHLTLALPRVFRHDLLLTRLDAEVNWQQDKHGLRLDYNAKRLGNADLDGSSAGHLILPQQGPVQVDIGGHLSRGDARAVYRYLPLAVGNDAYEWLRRGLLGGRSDDVRVVLKGSLDRFPFDKGGGEFRVSVNMIDGVLEYAPGWPRIDGVRGSLVFHDKAMQLDAEAGRIMGTSLGPVRVTIPDLHYIPDEIVLVQGVAQGETQAFLDFIRQSPVFGHTQRFTEHFRANGQGKLNLELNLPARRIDDSTVRGEFSFENNTLDPGGNIPTLSRLNGKLSFTENSVQARGIQVSLLDMPAQMDILDQGGLRAQLHGVATAATLAARLPAPIARRVSGAMQWHADVGLNAGKTSKLAVTSDLTGLGIDLPAPLGKVASQSLPVSISLQPAADGASTLTARYGTLAKLAARIPEQGEARIGLRVGGGEAAVPAESGLSISGAQAFLDLDAWRKLDWGAGGGDTSGFRQANLTFADLKLLDHHWHDTQVRLQPAGKGWEIRLAGKEVNGSVTTLPESQGLRVLGNFKRLNLIQAGSGTRDPTTAGDPNQLANLELNIDSLSLNSRELGALNIRLSPQRDGLKIERFVLTPAEGRIEGSGLVANHPRRPTHLNLKLEANNFGKLLGRFGHDDAVKGGEIDLTGHLDWTGGLEDFDLRTLNGDITVKAGRGQFLKVDPGAARLIGVLSLQSLPRRISLDFRDVFSQGFAFDDITGAVHLDKGTAYTRDLRMNGPAAKIQMSGLINLVQETQNLKVQVQPRLEDTVAVAGALLGGPAVGIGTFLANKILKNPIGQAVTFDYAVTGPWTEPIVTKVARPPTTAKPTDQ